MSERSPTVSIGVPVYNGEKYLGQALNSLIEQDFEDFEIIISDNASTDRTAEICRAFAAKDQRIRYFRNDTNIGCAPNYIRLVGLARGKYFKWCASDDRCHPTFLRRCVELGESAPASLVLVYPLCDLIGEYGEVLERAFDRMETKASKPHQRLNHALLEINNAYSLAGLIRTEVLRSIQIAGEVDYWDNVLLVELSLHGEFWEIPEVLFEIRVHANNAIAACSRHQGLEVWKDPNKADKKTRQALREWTNPATAKKRRFFLPLKEEFYWEYAKRVYRTPLPPFEKLQCFLTIPLAGYWRRFSKVAGTLRRRFRRTFFAHSKIGQRELFRP